MTCLLAISHQLRVLGHQGYVYCLEEARCLDGLHPQRRILIPAAQPGTQTRSNIIAYDADNILPR
jgi:hypothetical protein